MQKSFSLYLQKHHIDHLLPIIESRMNVLKKRILKENAHNWYDLDDSQIHLKCIDKNPEFKRLNQICDTIINQY